MEADPAYRDTRIVDLLGFRVLSVWEDILEDDLDFVQRTGLDGVACHWEHLPKVAARNFLALYVYSDPGGHVPPTREQAAILENMTWLRALRVSGEVDLTGMSQLKALATGWRKGRIGPRMPVELPEIESLSLATYAPSTKDLSGICAPKLRSLRLVEGNIRSLRGLERSPELRRVELTGLRHLLDISALTAAQSLEWLECDRCPAIHNFGALRACTELRELRINDCRVVSSISFVRELPNLHFVTLLGSTNVEDGDLSPAAGIEYVAITARAHYSHTGKDLMRMKRVTGI